MRRGVGDPGGADDRLAGGRGRGRLVVPLGVVAHDRALVARGVDPVDPRPALGGVDRAGGAEHDDRHAVAPGVEHRHGGVEQADVGVHGGGHRLAGHLGVAVRDRDRALLVQAEQHLRRLVAEIVDDRVVQAAIARAGIERDVGNVAARAACRRPRRCRSPARWCRSGWPGARAHGSMGGPHSQALSAAAAAWPFALVTG